MVRATGLSDREEEEEEEEETSGRRRLAEASWCLTQCEIGQRDARIVCGTGCEAKDAFPGEQT